MHNLSLYCSDTILVMYNTCYCESEVSSNISEYIQISLNNAKQFSTHMIIKRSGTANYWYLTCIPEVTRPFIFGIHQAVFETDLCIFLEILIKIKKRCKEMSF